MRGPEIEAEQNQLPRRDLSLDPYTRQEAQALDAMVIACSGLDHLPEQLRISVLNDPVGNLCAWAKSTSKELELRQRIYGLPPRSFLCGVRDRAVQGGATPEAAEEAMLAWAAGKLTKSPALNTLREFAAHAQRA